MDDGGKSALRSHAPVCTEGQFDRGNTEKTARLHNTAAQQKTPPHLAKIAPSLTKTQLSFLLSTLTF